MYSTPSNRKSRSFAITATVLIVSALVLAPSCGGEADVAAPETGPSEDTVGEQLPEAPISTEVVESDEQTSDAPDSTEEVQSLDEQLIEAVRAGDVDEVQALLDAGADVDATGSARSGTWTYSGAPAITHAVLKDHPAVLQLLIDNGAHLEKVELGYHDTALHTAAHLNNAEIVHMLLENGANPQPISKHLNWETPLHYAAEVGAVDAINALLDDGVDIDVQVDGRRTALMNVVKEGGARVAIKVAAVLLARGADPNLQENDGTTALHSAAERGTVDVVLLCIDHGADVDLQDGNGDTALHRAAKSDQADVIGILLDAGASLDVTNDAGETPVDLAASDEIADLFRQRGVSP